MQSCAREGGRSSSLLPKPSPSSRECTSHCCSLEISRLMALWLHPAAPLLRLKLWRSLIQQNLACASSMYRLRIRPFICVGAKAKKTTAPASIPSFRASRQIRAAHKSTLARQPLLMSMRACLSTQQSESRLSQLKLQRQVRYATRRPITNLTNLDHDVRGVAEYEWVTLKRGCPVKSRIGSLLIMRAQIVLGVDLLKYP